MKLRRLFFSLMLLGIAGTAFAVDAAEARGGRLDDSLRGINVVLVHGSWADGSSWSKVIPLLEEKGLNVVAVQNPLSSLADDVAATSHAINLLEGPVVLVGHSWGGAVITQAGNNPKVSALVYVAAFAPASGQSVNDLLAPFPAPSWVATLIPDEAGFLKLPASSVSEFFAQDLPRSEQQLLTVTQGPWFSGSLNEKVGTAAWETKPAWWVLPQNDRIIDPRLQAAEAAQMKAQVKHVSTSHVAMLADPRAVAEVIVSAAESLR